MWGLKRGRWSAVDDAELRALWSMFHQDGLTAFCARAGWVLRRTPGAVKDHLEYTGLHTPASVKLGRKQRWPFQHDRIRAD